MDIKFATRGGVVQIDDARIIYRNFEGRGDKFNRDGDRNFAVVIPNMELANKLLDDKNEDGASWNVKVKPPREEGDEPFIILPVKVKFNNRGPSIYLDSGRGKPVKLNEDNVGCLDVIDIRHVDLDIRPYDNFVNGKAFRSAYLQSMYVVQEVDRFAERYAEEEYPVD